MAVTLVPIKPLPKPVTLAAVKSDPAVKEIHLVKNSRLSVMPLTKAQYDHLLGMAK